MTSAASPNPRANHKLSEQLLWKCVEASANEIDWTAQLLHATVRWITLFQDKGRRDYMVRGTFCVRPRRLFDTMDCMATKIEMFRKASKLILKIETMKYWFNPVDNTQILEMFICYFIVWCFWKDLSLYLAILG